MDRLKDCKPLITYSGDARLFETLQSKVELALPSEAIEWKRSFGRASKNVVVDAKFIPFNSANISASSTLKSLLDHPIFHTYWVECPDADTYKSSIKEELTNWLSQLRQCGAASDWIIVLVETPEASRKANKLLPRTSVLDKLKADLGGKQPERCISLLDPSRLDSRSPDSLKTLLHRIRLLVLQAYSSTLGRFEDNMRTQRERRNDPKWNFCDYFLLQEELAFVYEMLGQYDEALVQYDELDALFTQFILNSHIAESPLWLKQFSSDFHNWSGVSLVESMDVNQQLREKVIAKTPTLLEVRNYLFARQGMLLLKMDKPLEVAKRALTFLHNVVQELLILEVNCPSGSVACWVLLSTLEILFTCQKVCDNTPNVPLTQYFAQTADLYSYARTKLYELGELCGLLPGVEPTSEHLHSVVELSAGIRDDHHLLQPDTASPVVKLKEALTSKNAFQNYFLELSETAISTYKHIGRIRFARLIGIDLAKFYLKLGQVQNAVTFLVDALKTFEWESWNSLTVKTLMDVSICYEKLHEPEKHLRICAMLACSKNHISAEDQMKNFYKMKELVKSIGDSVFSDADQLFKVVSCQILPQKSGSKCLMKKPVIPGSEVWIELQLDSNFPLDIPYDDISISMLQGPPVVQPVEASNEKARRKVNRQVMQTFAGAGTSGSGIHRTPSNRSTSSVMSSATNSLIHQESEEMYDSLDSVDQSTSGLKLEEENRLRISEDFDYKQDKSLCGVRIACRNANRFLRRKDSSGSMLKDTTARRGSFKYLFEIEHDDSLGDPLLKAGKNHLLLRTKAGPVGVYSLQQMSIRVFEKKLDFLADMNDSNFFPNAANELNRFSVISEPPTISLKRNVLGPLWSGINQEVVLSISTGSLKFEKDSMLKVRCSMGLSAGHAEGSELANTFQLKLPTSTSFETIEIPLKVKADLLHQHVKEGSTVEHRLFVEESWDRSQGEKLLHLHFVPPFSVQARIQTALTRKFLQVSFQATSTGGANSNEFCLRNHVLEWCGSSPQTVELLPINKSDTIMVLKRQSNCNYIWELISKNEEEKLDALKTKLTIQYERKDSQAGIIDKGEFSASFEFRDCQTLYVMRSRIDPAKGSELCRSSTICSLFIQVELINPTHHTSLMYEILADQAVWAVCGRAAGVINMENAKKQTLRIEVMPLIGGHLALPRVRLSRYIPAVITAGTSGANLSDVTQPSGSRDSSSIPRLEPFSSGQIYNCSRTSRIHVLPAPSSTVPSNINIKASASPLSQLHMFNHDIPSLGGEGHASLP